MESNSERKEDPPCDGEFFDPSSDDDDDDFVPNKRRRLKRQRSSAIKTAQKVKPVKISKHQQQSPVNALRKRPYQHHDTHIPALSRNEFVKMYPSLLDHYPLFYHILLPGMTVNSELVPKIGSIPPHFSTPDKCQALKAMFHRGRRILAQLDAFTRRCEPKYIGVDGCLSPLSDSVRTTVRDVRRKIVERCENYKYTRRDLLNK
jgi:hypothetical protein